MSGPKGGVPPGKARSRHVGSRHWGQMVLMLLLIASGAALWSRGHAVEWLLFGVMAVLALGCLLAPCIMIGRIEAARFLETAKVLADGDELRIRLVISSSGPLPFMWLAVSDEIVNVTSEAGPSLLYRRVLLPWFRQKQTVAYTVKGVQRGELSFEPVRIMVGDLLGMTVRTFRIECPASRLVMPRPPEAALGKWLPGIHSAKAALAAENGAPLSSAARAAGLSGGGLDMRAYVPGDPLRRVNWRAVARGLGMQTRVSESDAPCDTIIMLDASGAMFGGDPRMFDACVGRAALALRTVFDSGRGVKLMCSSKEELRLHIEAGDRDALREAEQRLARLRADGERPLAEWLVAVISRIPKAAKVVCITGGAIAHSGEGKDMMERTAKFAAVRGGRAHFWLAGEAPGPSGGQQQGKWFGGYVAYLPLHAAYRNQPVIEGGDCDACATTG
ncbi:DUF58 domain-containing protein [Paenibacillus oenotherae]|uniref:DUF58 domain-containing protein n=1 Tax=Paenibacillus oenotherae TaxID=1435645 RepID=A0ABS7D4L6_9BACL|nr:DUF58 domain-containing protein [Paenibacillus oenotherae]MBW7474874.1 DUF58 domain-containing protein [Paenibacillus oenotherae]